MGYSHFTLKRFLDEIYFNEPPYSKTEITSIEMYHFIKEKSDNFNLDFLELIIKDLRSYSTFIEFSVKNPNPKPELVIDTETGFPNSKSQKLVDDFEDYITTRLDSFFLYLDLNVNLKFHDEHSIRQRIDIVKKHVDIRFMEHDINNLLLFSDIAEEKYSLIKSKTLNVNSGYKKNNQQKQQNNSKSELTLAHIALICFYQDIPINNYNAEDVLKQYNNNSSVKKLIEKYNHFLIKNNRVTCSETKADNAKRKRLLDVIQYLKNNNLKYESAESDLIILEKNMNI